MCNSWHTSKVTAEPLNKAPRDGDSTPVSAQTQQGIHLPGDGGRSRRHANRPVRPLAATETAARRAKHRQQVLQQSGGAIGPQVHPASQVRRLHG